MLNRTECTALRGLAIVAIVLHNYCHFIGGIVQENEYLFRAANNDRLWQKLAQPDVLLPVHLLSYFGHYGVPVFLFLSGYGLVRKYEAKQVPAVGTYRFLRYNYLKLLRMLMVGFTLFIIVDVLTPGRFHFQWANVLAQLSMTINLLPTPDRIIWPGIYWFFGLMMELYVVYRLALYRRSSWVVGAIVAVCWLLQALSQPDGDVINRLRYNFVGGMLPFGAGILLARHGDKWPEMRAVGWAMACVVAFALAFALCFSFQTWLCVPLLVVAGCIGLVKALPPSWLQLPVWLGSLSAAMFVAHPIARKLFIVVGWRDGVYDGLMLYAVATIGLAWAVKQIIDHVPAPKL